MAYIICADTDPKPKGEWRYTVTSNGNTVWATTATDAVAVVLNTEHPETYLGLNDADAFQARYQFALSIAKNMKAFFQARALEGDDTNSVPPLVAFEPTDAETNAMACDITEPITGLPDDTWFCDDHPLVVFRPDYAPYSDIPMPKGNSILVIDPTDETTFLLSLSNTGVFKAQAL